MSNICHKLNSNHKKQFYFPAMLIALLVVLLFNQSYSQIPGSYFAVHCEVGSETRLFPTLQQLVASANSHNIPLTIEFTPPWAESILADSLKLKLIRQWQAEGHEIAAHHHATYYNDGWDGYTNDPSYISDPKYKGDMQDYLALLNRLAGDYPLLTGGITAASMDWPGDNMQYRTTGFAITDAKSEPILETLNSHEHYFIGYGALVRNDLLDSAENLYGLTKENEVFGLVTHVMNFTPDREQQAIEAWFEFAEGKNNKTVTQIMSDRGQGPVVSIVTMEPEKLNKKLFFSNSTVRYQTSSSGTTIFNIFDILGRKTKIYENQK
ncbi:MAG: hypothetical protein HQK83_14555 [Fibrobacteria bacterium]|nr:hypothetical protein [Fibrobacteria bacterium]